MQRRSLVSSIAVLSAALFGRRVAVSDALARPKLRTGWVWNADDWTYTYPYINIDCSLAESLDAGEVMRVGRAAVMPDMWVARDFDGELHECATEAEARAIASKAVAEQEAQDAADEAADAAVA